MKKIICYIFVCIAALSLTGCNIKFIEKVEPEPTTEPSTGSSFGTIIIDEPSKTPVASLNPTEEPSQSEADESTEPISTEEPTTAPLEEGAFIYNDVKFIKDKESPTMWIASDCPAKTKPSMDAKDYTFLNRGDFVTLMAISDDGKWAMVSIYGGPSSFVEYSNLSEEEINSGGQVGSLTTPTPEPTIQPPENTPEPTQEPTQTPVQTPTPSSTPEPTTEPEPTEDNYTGIAFPANASSTSYNMGVEFADLTITLTIRKETSVSNGPEAPSSSSGYYSMGTLYAGDTIKCTGIGRNGFVRVEYDGNIGYIDSRYVEY